MTTVRTKLISSLEKCFLDENIEDKAQKNHFTMLRNERLSFQIAYTVLDDPSAPEFFANRIAVEIQGKLAPYTTIRECVCVPVHKPTFQGSQGALLRTEAGLYPDLLRPLHFDHGICAPAGQLRSLWIDIELPPAYPSGTQTVSIVFSENHEQVASETATIRIKDAMLPPQTLIHTEWFHTDSIANYYRVPPFSEEHWTILSSFLKTAVRNGINMILTPILTLRADTYVGGERLTTQLIDIERMSDGTYVFDFGKLERWINLCLDCGVQYFEMPHLFSRGGTSTPKVIVKIGEERVKLFDWNTDPLGEEYASFLRQFLPAVVGVFQKRDLHRQCFFHISDEPHPEHLAQYLRCKALVKPYIGDCPIIDALSDIRFFESGAVEKPIPVTSKIEPFLKANIPGLWAYYAASHSKTSNRLHAMPLSRTRILGVQLYYYHIEGFLHWGYNFYNNLRSYDPINPFLCTDGEGYVGGDTFLVYPGDDKTAWESLRSNAMREAMDDIRALQLYESLFGREATEQLILEELDRPLTFTEYPTDPDYLLHLRERIAEAVTVSPEY